MPYPYHTASEGCSNVLKVNYTCAKPFWKRAMWSKAFPKRTEPYLDERLNANPYHAPLVRIASCHTKEVPPRRYLLSLRSDWVLFTGGQFGEVFSFLRPTVHSYRVYTVIRLRSRTPDAGSDPPFAPQCKRNTPAPIAGSDPPFALLLMGRGSTPDAGSDTAFLCV